MVDNHKQSLRWKWSRRGIVKDERASLTQLWLSWGTHIRIVDQTDLSWSHKSRAEKILYSENSGIISNIAFVSNTIVLFAPATMKWCNCSTSTVQISFWNPMWRKNFLGISILVHAYKVRVNNLGSCMRHERPVHKVTTPSWSRHNGWC